MKRMAGLSHLLLAPPSQPFTFNPDLYLQSATQTPWHLSGAQAGVVDLDGLKAVMMYYEAYRTVGDWRAAPEGLVRGAGEVSFMSSFASFNLRSCHSLTLASALLLSPSSTHRAYGHLMMRSIDRRDLLGTLA